MLDKIINCIAAVWFYFGVVYPIVAGISIIIAEVFFDATLWTWLWILAGWFVAFTLLILSGKHGVSGVSAGDEREGGGWSID